MICCSEYQHYIKGCATNANKSMHSHSAFSNGLFIQLASYAGVGATAFLTGLHVKQIDTEKLRGIVHDIQLLETELLKRKGHQFDVYKGFYDNMRALFNLLPFDPYSPQNYSIMTGLSSNTDQSDEAKHSVSQTARPPSDNS